MDTPIRGLLVDLDGVLYVGDDPIPGALEAVERLRRRGTGLRFLTNTSTKPAAAVAEKLFRLGIPATAAEVVSPVRAALTTLRRREAKAPYLVVDERLAPEFSEFSSAGAFPAPPTGKPDSIVIGDIGRRWSYDLMNRLFSLVTAGAAMVALHKGRTWRTEAGLQIDIGAFVTGLEYATGVQAIVTGKPSPEFFRAALDDLGLAAEEVVMAGDDIDSDIGGAQAIGIRGVLVRTGKYRPDYVGKSAIAPWRTIASFAEIDTLPGLLDEQEP